MSSNFWTKEVRLTEREYNQLRKVLTQFEPLMEEGWATTMNQRERTAVKNTMAKLRDVFEVSPNVDSTST